ncbi:MAG: hypothetical protein WAL52_21175 [Candidatus Sulfotelmatobacter sp.]
MPVSVVFLYEDFLFGKEFAVLVGRSMMSKVPRRVLKVFVGAAVVFGLLIGYMRFSSGKIRGYEISPDGRYVAEWRVYDQHSATTTDFGAVQLRERSSPFRRTVLSGLDYGAQISLVWTDSENLVVQCGRCGAFQIKCDTCGDALYVVAKETGWRNVKIHYTNQSLRDDRNAR